MEELIKQFNGTFEGKAKAILEKDRLCIVIGDCKFKISLPGFIGVECDTTQLIESTSSIANTDLKEEKV